MHGMILFLTMNDGFFVVAVVFMRRGVEKMKC
jgi:hypothetical protein